MIDWHSHILPKMDDGSRDVAESVALVKMLGEQGADTVIATPHFHANRESLESFLDRRCAAYNALVKELDGAHPNLVLGAEVRYYSGISQMENLKRLQIGESGLLLLEMPMGKWTEYTVREVLQLAASSELTVVLAHIERYFSLQSKGVWKRLYENGVLAQVNASFFTGVFTKRRALNMLSDGGIHFIGSDCHGVTSRPPKIGKAFDMIRKHLGDDFISQMNGYGKAVLAQNI